jgi:hypothetical protein
MATETTLAPSIGEIAPKLCTSSLPSAQIERLKQQQRMVVAGGLEPLLQNLVFTFQIDDLGKAACVASARVFAGRTGGTMNRGIAERMMKTTFLAGITEKQELLDGLNIPHPKGPFLVTGIQHTDGITRGEKGLWIADMVAKLPMNLPTGVAGRSSVSQSDAVLGAMNRCQALNEGLK